MVELVGGKGAQLGELAHIKDVCVPPGFCITTDAFRQMVTDAPLIDDHVDQLSRLTPDDREAIRAQSAELRRIIEAIVIPDDVAAAITREIIKLGEHAAYAVRSSATAEDLPTASFAGQHDTYLHLVGIAAIFQHVSRCWASLFTERAVTYRLHKGVDHRKVQMGVVVQQMVFPHAAGVLFTADPVSGNRKVCSIEASFGLGEALVSGLVNADVYTVRSNAIVSKMATREEPALTDAQVVRLAQLGRRIEAHFGCPQDIEWCLVHERPTNDEFQFVQSRAITTLFPIPAAADGENHVYVSVGHQQMMTDPLKPLGLSFWQMTTPRPMAEAGGRLFVDVTQPLASPASRAALLAALGKSDPLITDALQTVLDRGDFIRSRPDEGPAWAPPGAGAASLPTDAGHRHRTDRAQRGLHCDREARHPDEVRSGAARVHPGGHPGGEASPVRSAEHAGDHGGDGGRVVAERPHADVAGREERGRHAHAVCPAQRHVGDGAGAAGRRGRHPSGIRRSWRFCSRSGTTAFSTSCPGSQVGGKRATPSRPGSIDTACAASARSTSPDRAGLNAPPCSCP